MLIGHLALTVRDPRESRDFYLSVIGLDGEARNPLGYRVDLTNGFMLALIRGEPLPPGSADRVHFGSPLSCAEDAYSLRARLREAGTREVEWEDSGTYVGVKVEDPDGYILELAYDVS